jgi:NAD(P)-dependent dehydrogenase (short-subunit alcohol dehydrogenase family)/acyl carrier protein
VTHGAAAVGPATEEVDVRQAPLWGMGRVIRLEHPDLWGGLIDLAPDVAPEAQAEALLAELLDSEGEDQIAFRAGRRFVLRIRPEENEDPPPGTRRAAEDFRLDAAKTYLITGGLGGLGLTIAERMVKRGARNLVLAGRSGGSSRARRRVQELEEAGARVVVAQADVSRAGDVERLIGEIRSGLPPLGGIVHAAAVLDDGILLRQDSRRLAAVMAPKAIGAWNLHQQTRELPIDFFLLFSSAASLLGWYGQGTYAAANAFLDALAHHRRAQGLPAVSINWGPWSEIGLTSRLSNARKSRIGNKGVRSLEPAQGLEAIERVLTRSPAQVAVLSIDWSVFLQSSERERQWKLLEGLTTDAQRGPAPSVALGGAFGLRLQDSGAEDRLGLLVAHIRGEVAAILGLPPERSPEPRRGFFDMGMDSLMALELKNRLEASLGRRLPATLAFESPTIESLAVQLLDLVTPPCHVVAPPARAAVAEARDGALDEVLRLSDEELELLIDQEYQRSIL